MPFAFSFLPMSVEFGRQALPAILAHRFGDARDVGVAFVGVRREADVGGDRHRRRIDVRDAKHVHVGSQLVEIAAQAGRSIRSRVHADVRAGALHAVAVEYLAQLGRRLAHVGRDLDGLVADLRDAGDGALEVGRAACRTACRAGCRWARTCGREEGTAAWPLGSGTRRPEDAAAPVGAERLHETAAGEVGHVELHVWSQCHRHARCERR